MDAGKAPTAGAGVVHLDLEDAVAPDGKEQARNNIVQAMDTPDCSSCVIAPNQ